MVDAHQRSGLSALGFVQLQLGHPSGWVGATGAGLCDQGSQCAVGGQNQSIDHSSSVNNRFLRGEKVDIARGWLWVVEFITGDKFVSKEAGSACHD
jgi:hypothetical protein